MQDILNGTAGLSFSRMRQEHPHNEDYHLHAHENYELLYFIEGRGRYLVEGHEYPIGKDCVMIMRPGEVHRLLIDETVPYERICINFRPEILEPLDPEGVLLSLYDGRPLGTHNRYTVDHGEELLALLPETGKDAPSGIFELAARLFLFRCLYELCRQSGQQHPTTDSIPLEPVLQYINSHLTEELSLSHVTSRFYISPAQLNRLMKRSVGTTFWNYVQVKRLLIAKTMIRHGAPAGEAAARCGFGEYSAFYRAYRKQFGVSPLADRQLSPPAEAEST